MVSYSGFDSIYESLTKEYRQLPSEERVMVQLFAVIYEAINRTLFITCWNALPEGDRFGKSLNTTTVRAYLERLLAKEILVQHAGLGPQCNPLLAEIATRDAIYEKRFERLVQAVNTGFPLPRRWKNGPLAISNDRQLVREVRISLYRNDLKTISQQLEDYYRYNYHKNKLTLEIILKQIVNNPFDANWVRSLSVSLQERILVSSLASSMLELQPADGAFLLLREQVTTQKNAQSLRLFPLFIEQLLLRSEWTQAEELLQNVPGEEDRFRSLLGFLEFMRGDDQAAIAHYTLDLKALKKATGKKKIFFPGMSGVFFVLLLIKDGSPERLKEAAEYASIARQEKHWLSQTYAVLEHFIATHQGELSRKNKILATPIASHSAGNAIETLILSLCLYWSDEEQARKSLPKLLSSFYCDAEEAGYTWLAQMAGQFLLKISPRNSLSKSIKAQLETLKGRSLVELLQPQETWELCLNALLGLRKEESLTTTKSTMNRRLVWFITLYGEKVVLQPREQSINAKGDWTKGRPIALKRLKSQADELDYLTPQDLRVCSQITTYTYGWRNDTEYTFGEKAIALLAGHPLVFWEDSPTTRLEIVKGEPELLVKKGKNDQLTLQFSPEIKDPTQEVLVTKTSPTQLKVIDITPEHRRIAEILGNKNRLEVPVAAKDRVLSAIQAVSSIVTVHSDIGGGIALEEVPADSTPHVHLLPAVAGLKVAVLSRPFAQGGSYYRPGSGGETVIAEIDGKRLQTSRNLREEKKRANLAIAACPTLARQEQQDNEWLVEDPEDCLELLLELQALGDDVIIEHPEGEKFRVNHQASLQNFRFNIKQQNDWFSASGELRISDELVLDMKQLMQLLDQTSSRFIPIAEGEFLALTQEFRKRLDELRTYADSSGKGLKLHPLAALAIEDWIDEVGELKADKHWKTHIQRLKEVKTLEPQLPSTLQAELRDYQVEGFRWLARLSHWGVGGCLADDMGLGKTLQALAVILTRAPQGATLIVAPTSVCMNWISEAERFAPTLKPIQFGSGDRQKVLDNLKPFDLLVCSYGLLQQEEVAEMLAKVQWQTIVLDEAQSIKNFATKRSQAAMNLQGGFKLLTTGTPIENHLGELWNLFRFINPGLLGSLDSFNQRFANPIERYGDRQARNRLKKLIQPFLLRRTKNQVLEELPSRTEILLQVDLSSEELAFYEALRQEAIAKLSESDVTAGAKHLQVLAEIMRLRRACCNTRLVKPDIALPSSKLQLFGEILAELLENKHKALVFSQFVDHLHLIRDYLNEQNISYQYLDGSTPAPERKKRVNAFQSGDGDVFLISLKAGGTGLNLTAADYVIHMDPWWNPAVEDQASDRAHRIGQQRPVTIYRLVAKGTIEEKIVQLHQHKRDLADSLLEGAEMTGKVSTEELLRLISEG
jgi:SNF2 family DNA or RNA helicase